MRKLPHMTSQQAFGIIPEFQLKDRMRLAREVTRLDQAGFAERLGISRATVSNVERGATNPSKLVIRAWALATGVSRPWLETGETPTGNDPDGGLENVAPPTGLEPVTLWFTRSGLAKDMLLGQHEPYRIAA